MIAISELVGFYAPIGGGQPRNLVLDRLYSEIPGNINKRSLSSMGGKFDAKKKLFKDRGKAIVGQ